jgi:amidase
VIRPDEQALQAAGQADRITIASGELPPFPGVPFTIKENIDVAGTPTTQGAKALINAYPTRDAPVVERMRAAGGIPIGRTNLPTYAIRWHTDSELWGQTINPWDRTRTPGASSGGEAVALATGMSPLGLGNDTLGLPAVAVPIGIADGLPQVIQIIGPRYREDLCLNAAAAIEDALGIITPIDPR